MKIEKNVLVDEIVCALKDEFVASVTSAGDEITLAFENGQVFTLTVNEQA